jgi:hypothetical protein
MQNIGKKLNILANITIIIFGLIVSVLLVKRQFFSESKFTTNNIKIGKRFPLEGVKWDQSNHTLFLVITDNCKYCTDSAPFYRQLAEMRGQYKLKLTVITLDRSDEGQKYINSLGITVDEVKQLGDKSIGTVRTPTIILADGSGIVTGVWSGKLTSAKEMEVLDKLKGVSPKD